MKLPRDLSGAVFIDVLCRDFGYRRIHQVGSHVILETAEPRQHRLSVPNHDPLRLGTLNALIRAVADAKGIDKSKLLSRLR
jgi:predicted RNA binding protein YcfA (HicA-like mRNA interferase family)